MVAIGQLLASYSFNVICSDVAGTTSVDYNLLLEDTEFQKVVIKANKFAELYDWVNENY